MKNIVGWDSYVPACSIEASELFQWKSSEEVIENNINKTSHRRSI
ncbi:hypothetical protein [Mammaliicoccus lentus]|nr:hypothetical protein [Mammaliicoccus lentus]